MKKLILAASLAVLSTAAAGAPPKLPDADPALWVAKDADTTVYLFGTFHMLDGKQEWFNDEVKRAFDASSEVMLEAIVPEDPAAMQPLIVKYAVDPKGRRLTQKLTPEMAAKLGRTTSALGLPDGALETMEPWFVSMTLAVLGMNAFGISGEHGPEGVLTKAAHAAGKPVGELEGMEVQLAMFDAMPEGEQIAFLGQTIDFLDTIDQQVAPLLAGWQRGDVAVITRMQDESLEKTPALYERIYSRRNAAWADWIGRRMNRPGTVFVAVGAGHLAGKDSVQDLLAKRGIVTDRVRN